MKYSFTSKIKLSLTLVFVLLSVSCSNVYKQLEGIDPEKIAILEHVNPQRSLFVIEEVDNKWRGFGLIDRYELLPGKHVITCALQKPSKNGAKSIVRFNAEAGKKYRAEIRVSDKDWVVVIVEDATRKVVSTNM